MGALKPKVRDDLTVASFEDDCVVYRGNDDHGHLHYLNPEATLVFRLCDGTGTVPELAADIAAAYGLPQAEIEQQVRGIVRLFRRSDLLTWKPVVRRGAADHDHDHVHDHEHDHDHDHEHADGDATGTRDERGRIRREVPRSS